MDVSLILLLNAMALGAVVCQESTTISALYLRGSTIKAVTSTDIPTEGQKCITTWRLPGKCIARMMCDNNTPAIDLTPYAPRGPKRVCLKGEVCCPLDLIVTSTQSSPDTTQKAATQEFDPKFEFDDDD